MLYLDMQKREEAMKAEKFQQKILGTAVCTKRLMMATKGCGQLMSNDTYFVCHRIPIFFASSAISIIILDAVFFFFDIVIATISTIVVSIVVIVAFVNESSVTPSSSFIVLIVPCQRMHWRLRRWLL